MPKLLRAAPKPNESFKEYIKQNVSPVLYYKSRFPEWNDSSPRNVICPWHQEKTGSLALNLRGGGAKCHGCDKSIGNIIHFEVELKKEEERLTCIRLYTEFLFPIFPRKQVEDYHENLKQMHRIQSCIQKDTLLNENTILQFTLGWHLDKRRLVIPIHSPFGFWEMIRYYKLPSMRNTESKVPKIYNEKGYGHASLFPFQCIPKYKRSKPVYWMKAERDVMLAIQDGYQAVCTTGGGEAVDITPWIHLFEDFEVIIVGDEDKVGVEHAQNKFNLLKNKVEKVSIVRLPFTPTELRLGSKDYSDWRIDCEAWPGELAEQPDSIGIQKTRINGHDFNTEPQKKFASLQTLRHDLSYQNTKCTTRGLVSGVFNKVYSLPCTFDIQSFSSPAREFKIDPSREQIAMMGMDDEDILKFVRKLVKNKHAKIDPTNLTTAVEVEISPLAGENESQNVNYKAVFLGLDFKPNTPYELDIIPTTAIKTQEQIGIVTRATPVSLALDSNTFTDKDFQRLKIFKASENVYESFCSFANEVAENYTHIYNRLDSHILALLTWLSPLYFNFPGEKDCKRGWINALILGDTQTGKSEIAKNLAKIFNCGTFISAENCSFVGLVGGTVKSSGDQFILRWGRIPTSDRQLIVIEELSGLSTIEISRMSEVRSSGIARIDKGGISQETNSRCRLLVLSNVRSNLGTGRSISSFPSGVHAVCDLIGQPEDVSRFDLITTTTDAEVSSDVINVSFQERESQSDKLNVYHEKDLQLLVKFIWSLKSDQIEITHEAYLASLQNTKEMSEIYHPSIPIFKGGSGRILLARIATAFACATFSIDDKTKKVQVQKRHVIAARTLLETLYKKPSFGYYRYSKNKFDKEKVKDGASVLDIIVLELKKPEKINRLLEHLKNEDCFTERDLLSVTNLIESRLRFITGAMIDAHIIEKVPKIGWRLTQAGRNWIDENLN